MTISKPRSISAKLGIAFLSLPMFISCAGLSKSGNTKPPFETQAHKLTAQIQEGGLTPELETKANELVRRISAKHTGSNDSFYTPPPGETIANLKLRQAVATAKQK